MEELTVFEGHEVRFFPTEDGSFEVVAADVAKVLEYGDTSNFANLVSDKYKYTRQNLPGGYKEKNKSVACDAFFRTRSG